MTDRQWNQLLSVLRGETLDPLPIGFIVDCPWLPGWCGLPIAEYRLAALYEKGVGVAKDAARARELYTKSAEAGNSRAMLARATRCSSIPSAATMASPSRKTTRLPWAR